MDCYEERGLYAQSTPRLTVSLLHRCVILVIAEKNSSEERMYIVYGRLRAFCNFGFESFPSPLLDRTYNCHCSLSEQWQSIYRDSSRNSCILESLSASFQAKAGACQASTTAQDRAKGGLQVYQSYHHIKHWKQQTTSGASEGLEAGQSAQCLARAEGAHADRHTNLSRKGIHIYVQTWSKFALKLSLHQYRIRFYLSRAGLETFI